MATINETHSTLADIKNELGCIGPLLVIVIFLLMMSTCSLWKIENHLEKQVEIEEKQP